MDDVRMRGELPSGTVTFLFTDIEGSTRLLDELGDVRYGMLLAEHHRVCREVWQAHHGVEVDTAGDAFFVAFALASDALAAAAAAQTALSSMQSRVRMGLHTGEVSLNETGYVGLQVHRAARIAAAGHGGQVLVSSSTAALVGTKRLRDLGQHRFKDLRAPERVFQLGDGEFPPLKSLFRTNLPVPATLFLGREREVAELVELLAQRSVRLLTLTGPGGTGKTRLALQAVAEAAEVYPDGVWWIPLASIRDSGLILPAVAQALELKEQLETSLEETLRTRLATRRLILLLDNAEHLLPYAVGSIAALRDAGATIVVTSRERLRLKGEQAWPVPPLAERDGVDLFVARAAEAGAPSERSGAIGELCRRLDAAVGDRVGCRADAAVLARAVAGTHRAAAQLAEGRT